MNSHDQHDQHNKTTCEDRSGMSTVEFTLLLPFVAALAASLFSVGFLFYRSIGQSYASFGAARRCAVSGRPAAADRFVRADYRAYSMPGTPQVTASFVPGQPGRCRVTVRDRFASLEPGERGGIRIQDRPGASVVVTAAGTAPCMGGDNDL